MGVMMWGNARAVFSKLFVVFFGVIGLCVVLHGRPQPCDLIKRIQLLGDLKNDFQRRGLISQAPDGDINSSNGVSATEAYLSVPELSVWVEEAFKLYLVTHKKLIGALVAKEKEFASTHYVFYHAQRAHFRVMEDFLRELFPLLHIKPSLNAFWFLRCFDKQSKIYTHVNDFLLDCDCIYANVCEGYTNEKWHDGLPDTRDKLLSVNLSLFGSTTMIYNSESTFDFFVHGKNIYKPEIGEEILKPFFDLCGFNSTYIDNLVSVASEIMTEEGNLVQIFIPKTKVDSCVYICHAFGYPYRTSLIESCFDEILRRHTCCTPILEQYQHNPSRFNAGEFDRIQARILLNHELMHDPASGVKIFRYTTVDDDKLAVYQARLKQITVEIVQDWIAHRECEGVSGSELLRETALDKLITYTQCDD